MGCRYPYFAYVLVWGPNQHLELSSREFNMGQHKGPRDEQQCFVIVWACKSQSHRLDCHPYKPRNAKP